MSLDGYVHITKDLFPEADDAQFFVPTMHGRAEGSRYIHYVRAGTLRRTRPASPHSTVSVSTPSQPVRNKG